MKIIIDKRKCVGCGNCQMACQKFFKIGDDGRSHIKQGKEGKEDYIEELEISDPKDIECAKNAADACPMQCITVK